MAGAVRWMCRKQTSTQQPSFAAWPNDGLFCTATVSDMAKRDTRVLQNAVIDDFSPRPKDRQHGIILAIVLTEALEPTDMRRRHTRLQRAAFITISAHCRASSALARGGQNAQHCHAKRRLHLGCSIYGIPVPCIISGIINIGDSAHCSRGTH